MSPEERAQALHLLAARFDEFAVSLHVHASRLATAAAETGWQSVSAGACRARLDECSASLRARAAIVLDGAEALRAMARAQVAAR